MSSCTINCFSYFIILENFFCINRAFLIQCPRKNIIANIIFLFTLTFLITFVIFDILTTNVNFSTRMFQGFLGVEFIDLFITARVRSNSFDALKRLDEKCGIENGYIEKLVANSTKYSFFLIICAVIDVIGIIVVCNSVSEIAFYFILFSAQDAELIFFSMIVEAINLRLSKLQNLSPVAGAKVYRHVLVATALIDEEVSPRIILLLAVILGTTVTYSSTVMLSLTDTGARLHMFLLWRELKVFFCLWRVCYESWRSEFICQQLAFQLARRLAQDPALAKGKNVQSRRLLRRWWDAVLTERPRFMRGSMLSIGLAVPLYLLDLSVNYVLIIIQIYVAYN